MQLGVIGLGPMGTNLARNAARSGATVAVFNRTPERLDEFLKEHRNEGMFVPCKSSAYLVAALKSPRSILLMVKAGEAVDEVIAQIAPLLSKGDILIDGGNSHYRDTERRERDLFKKGIRFVGMGVSGGEEGALRGPSMMPGGERSAYEVLEPLFLKMAAQDGTGGKCVTWIGPGGSGHFVKMVHNGIEYALMQLIAECYHLLKSDAGLSNAELADLFEEWNRNGALQSFLVEITAKIFRRKDPETSGDLIDVIKDSAGQKGTGKWTTEAAFELGSATPTIDSAVAARILSGDPKRAARNREGFPAGLIEEGTMQPPEVQERARAALECSMICVYNQGFHLIERASDAYGWSMRMGEIARIWRGGCIIRSALLDMFQRACDSDASAGACATEEIVGRFGESRQRDWRRFLAHALSRGIPMPAMTASLAYFDTLRAGRLPQNLIAAQRDFFGAHTYERTDRPGTFHTDWSHG